MPFLFQPLFVVLNLIPLETKSSGSVVFSAAEEEAEETGETDDLGGLGDLADLGDLGALQEGVEEDDIVEQIAKLLEETEVLEEELIVDTSAQKGGVFETNEASLLLDRADWLHVEDLKGCLKNSSVCPFSFCFSFAWLIIYPTLLWLVLWKHELLSSFSSLVD